MGEFRGGEQVMGDWKKKGSFSLRTARSYWSDPKTIFVFVLRKNLAKLVTKRINSR